LQGVAEADWDPSNYLNKKAKKNCRTQAKLKNIKTPLRHMGWRTNLERGTGPRKAGGGANKFVQTKGLLKGIGVTSKY